jgi:transposase
VGKGSGSGMTRGDRRRNARRERLRAMLPREGAVIGIDLAEDKQAIAVVDHDGRVLARKTVRVKAFRLGEALDWAVGQARVRMFADVAVPAVARVPQALLTSHSHPAAGREAADSAPPARPGYEA